MQRFLKLFVVTLTLFSMSAPCFCWVQMVDMPGCHAAAKMEDCCCTQDAAVDYEMPVRDLAVLPVEWHNPQLDAAVLAVSDVSFVSPSLFQPRKGHDRGGTLRSPPDLYLLHATFLI